MLVTEDGLECKSEDDKRWNGTLPQFSFFPATGLSKSSELQRALPEDSCDHRGDAGLLHVRGGGLLFVFSASFEAPHLPPFLCRVRSWKAW